MDALLTSFVVAGLAEFGDRTQLLAALLAARFGRPGSILAGIGLGALVHMILGAAAGTFANDFILLRTAALLVAVALLFAGVTSLIVRTPPQQLAAQSPFLAALGGGFALEFADKSQFLAFALAARSDSVVLPSLGATAGILAACLPAVALGPRFGEAVPIRPFRIGIAILLILAAALVTVNARGLI